MRNTILRYGIISGITLAVLMFATTLLLDKVGYGYGEAIGYTCMVLGFLPTFFGARKFRDTVNEGTIGFGRAFAVSILTALFANLFYVAAWLIIYYNMPELMAKYAMYSVDQLKAAGKSQKDIDAVLQQMQQVKELYKNPLINAAITYTEPLAGTIVFSLITALIIRRKPSSPLLPQ
jgi:hypothetical protein